MRRMNKKEKGNARSEDRAKPPSRVSATLWPKSSGFCMSIEGRAGERRPAPSVRPLLSARYAFLCAPLAISRRADHARVL
jgi:hypothetical protein